MAASKLGPDLVIAGAARSGTSALAAQLSSHPDIDAGSIKESNYFSRDLGRGPCWYDGLYRDRRAGLLRMDASTSYTSAVYPDALARLAAAAPDALVVYVVRQPTERALSHYLFRRHHFRIDDATDFGSALAASSYYLDASDYARWLAQLRALFGEQQVLVVPFEVVTTSPQDATTQISSQLGLAAPTAAAQQGRRHRNDVVEYRNAATQRAARMLRRSPLYPRLRATLGADRVREARELFTRQPRLPSTAEAMASCTPEQLDRLRRLDERAGAAVQDHLVGQDARLGLGWAPKSFAAGA